MSLRKKQVEIKRLIEAFELEAAKFHDLKFSTVLFEANGPGSDRKFEPDNHAIMLWQYYGQLKKGDQLLQDIKDSDLQWGVRGATITTMGVLEGKSYKLFMRMAKRAGSLFSEKEISGLRSKVLEEIVESEKSNFSKPVSVENDNTLAIWLSYLLYYTSKVNPRREKTTYIEPDPYSLSLLALEQLLVEPHIGKVDKSQTKVEQVEFKVALSFPGEKRTYVSKVADLLKLDLEKDEVFYDLDYQSQLAKPNLDAVLQKIYRYNSGLVVVFLCEEYSQKEWCGLEWRAIREIIKCRADDRIMFIRFDNCEIEGVFSIDGFIDANNYSETDISKFILERISLLNE